MDELRFWKYHGTGNDFVLLEDVAGRLELGEEFARRLCDRRFGIGGDGVIRVAPS
ncbi:MAG TPA: diaminopimelate epimerase, partial [Actinomycetota bacterium]|nr:diaminopimelate epimerase [Actinomycetota bacterium]